MSDREKPYSIEGTYLQPIDLIGLKIIDAKEGEKGAFFEITLTNNVHLFVTKGWILHAKHRIDIVAREVGK